MTRLVTSKLLQLGVVDPIDVHGLPFVALLKNVGSDIERGADHALGHRAGEPLTDDDIQPEQPSLGQRRVLGAEATQVLREFAAAAETKGPQHARKSHVPTPDWKAKKTAGPFTLLRSKSSQQ